MDIEKMEAFARKMSISEHEATDREKMLVAILQQFGEHSWETCAKFGEHGSIENDCSCGWGPIHYYFNVYQSNRGLR